MMQGDFHGMEGPKAGRDFRGSVPPWRFETPPLRCQAALDDTLAETQSTQRERRVRVMTENEMGKQIVDCAVQIHRELGPGLLEMVYEIILAHELLNCASGVYGLNDRFPSPSSTRALSSMKASARTSSSRTRSLWSSSVLQSSTTPTGSNSSLTSASRG